MRRLLCLLALVLVAVPASAQVTSITTTNLINGGSPTDPETSVGSLVTTNGALQLILVGFADSDPESTISSITCTCFANAAQVATAEGTGVRISMWRAVGNGGTAQVTLDFSGAISNLEVMVLEVIGAKSASNYSTAFQQTVTGPETAATTSCDLGASGPMAAITAGSAVVMLCTTTVNATTFVADAGWTEAGTEVGNNSPSITFGALYALNPSDTTPTGTWGASGTSRAMAVEILQEPATAGCGRSLLLGVGC